MGHAKVVLRGVFAAKNTYIKEEEISQIKKITFYLKRHEKEEQTKARTRRKRNN